MSETVHDKLREHAFFRGLSPEAVDVVAGCARLVRVPPASYLARQGEPSTGFFAITRGRVSIELHGAGSGPIMVETIKDGDILGWSWLVSPHEWAFDGRALEDTEAVAVDGACLRGKCDNQPVIGYDLMKRFTAVFAGRLQATRLQLLDLYGSPSAT